MSWKSRRYRTAAAVELTESDRRGDFEQSGGGRRGRATRAGTVLEGDEAAADAPAGSRVRGRILVVDDEAGVRKILARMLGLEHEVVTAASGREACAVLEADRRFDLIICDLMMAELSGMALHAWLAEKEPGLAERLIFITGGVFTPAAAEYLARVDNLRIEKPFDPREFVQLVGQRVSAVRSSSAE